MNKKLLIFIFGILIFSGTVISQSSMLNYDYACSQNLTISQSDLAIRVKEPIPYYIPYPNATCFSSGCISQEVPLIPINVDINNDGKIDGTIIYTKYDAGIPNYNFSFTNFGPIIKYNNITILQKIDFCYILDDKVICENNENTIFHKNIFIPIKFGNRLDIFSTINFNTRKKVDDICPLSFDFGDWPKSYLSPVSDEKRLNWKLTKIDASTRQFECTLPPSLSFPEIGVEGYVYNKTLILLGEDGLGVIITKPDNYYFLLNNTEKSKKVRVCTKDQNDTISLINGINLFSFAGIQDEYKISALSFLLSLPSVLVSVQGTQIVKIKNFLTGNALPFNFQSPQMKIILDFSMEDKYYGIWPYMDFTYTDVNGEHPAHILPKDDKYHFEEIIVLEGNPVYFPFLKYKTTIYNTYPKKISENKIPLSFEEGSSFTGYAYFNKDKIDIMIYPKVMLIVFYLVGLIYSSILFYFMMKHIKKMTKESFQPKLSYEFISYMGILISPILGSGLNLNLITSIGFIPHTIYVIILPIYYLYKRQKLR